MRWCVIWCILVGLASALGTILPPVYIALRQQNLDILHARLLDISAPTSANYGAWMSIEDINQLAHPPAEHQSQVLDWLGEYNVSDVENYGDAIKFSTTPDKVRAMFQIEGAGTNPGTPRCFFGYTVPPHLRSIVEFVEMCSRPVHRRPKINRRREGAGVDDRYFAREPLVRLYNVTHPNLGRRVSGGLVEYQSNAGFTNEDVDRQQILNEQDVQNVTRIVGVNQGIDPESELDVQMMSQAADGVSAWFWDTPNWLYAFAVDFFNSADVPDVISMSWGWAQDSQCDIIDCSGNLTSQHYVRRVNSEYLKIALRGITIVASSGDAGAPGRTNEGCDAARPINPIFPGSSMYVVSVGATFVPMDNTTRNYTTPLCRNDGCMTSSDEKSIRFDRVGWTAGGGFDLYQQRTPIWQRKAVAGYLSSGVQLPDGNFNREGRAYPDVSAIGHSCPTVLDGMLTPVDGTSCSAPVVAGLIAIMNDYMAAHNRFRVGFVNPLLYHMHAHCAECFHDITDGYNWCTEGGCCDNATDYGFVATAGYDPVAGLGTLNVGRILAYLQRHVLAPSPTPPHTRRDDRHSASRLKLRRRLTV